MKNMWKLSNYFLAWMMKRGMAYLFFVVYLFGGLGCLMANAFPRAAGAMDWNHPAEAFRAYETLLGNSFFVFGLILLFFEIFRHAKSYQTNGREIYTLLTLPMRREEIYFAFLLSGAALVALYFMGWLLLILVGYAPIMANHVKVAAQEIFYVSPELTVSGLDATRTNGLFLAFQRNTMLYTFFPTNPARLFALLSGLLLILTSGLYCGLSLGEKSEGILLLLASSLLGGYSIAQAAFYHSGVDFYTAFRAKTLTGGSVILAILCLLGAIGVICLSIRRIRRSYTL